MPNTTHEFTTEDVEYRRHGDARLIARLYKPKGDGPFPAVIDLHGGAWTSGDLTGTQGLDESLANGALHICGHSTALRTILLTGYSG